MLATIRPQEVHGLGPHHRRHPSSYSGHTRIPKLAVRSVVSEDEHAGDGSPSPKGRLRRDDGVRPPPSSCSSVSTTLPTLERTHSDQSHDSQDSLDTIRQRRSSFAPAKTKAADSKRKNKAASVLGFLTLKEPSTAAWEEFAEAQRKAAAQKGGRVSAVRPAGVSSQRLPDFVPKTNSKWDGLPGNTQRTSAQRTNSKRLSTFSTGSKQTTRTTSTTRADFGDEFAKRFGSLSSKPGRRSTSSSGSSMRSSMRVTGSMQSLPEDAGESSTHSPRRGDEPKRSLQQQQHPNDRPESSLSCGKEVARWDQSPLQESLNRDVEVPQELAREKALAILGAQKRVDTFLHPPSPPYVLPDMSSLMQTPELELPETSLLDVSQPTQHISSPAEQSPLTPPADENLLFTTVAEHEPAVKSIGAVTQSENVTFWHSDTDTDTEPFRTVRSGGTHTVPNFSRPRVAKYVLANAHPDLPLEPIIDEDIRTESEGSDWLQPTLRDDKGRTSPFVNTHLPLQAQNLATSTSSSLPAALVRTQSMSSRVTSITIGTATTVTPTLDSPTFSENTSELPSRPSTAASSVSTVTATPRLSTSPPRSNSDAVSVAPSEMSVQWTMTPKERLGLGGKLIRREQADVLPWEKEGEIVTSVAAKRLSTASSLAPTEGGRLKRLSIRLSRR
ncbi:hypothetical protein BAUCODRAFT_238257 [Baudoinia panamericana UAMH 10762]|uniref:Uncharacterized protein n=1 Tax=Baudoinia panamericana (strain UAMH 10762) TaxID=717646 RepID=M2MPH4_BAUPA|nr:uncharacterized protein BAUCODRAFT_238257 [Baudoinia panamericana UAMH 10762]EMC93363.1 hypothetical protein BAUCODRAFT_238257 [Baudoinia panamericana UAMH 10762]